VTCVFSKKRLITHMKWSKTRCKAHPWFYKSTYASIFQEWRCSSKDVPALKKSHFDTENTRKHAKNYRTSRGTWPVFIRSFFSNSKRRSRFSLKRLLAISTGAHSNLRSWFPLPFYFMFETAAVFINKSWSLYQPNDRN
jgi:hypothetical protein